MLKTKEILSSFQDKIKDSYVLTATVESVHENYFNVLIDNQLLECHTSESISHLKANDQVKISGKISCDDKFFMKLILNLEYFYLISEESAYMDVLVNYNKLLRVINTDKYRKIIHTIKQLEPPSIIKNIAVLVPNIGYDIDGFRKGFIEKNCKCNMFIYYLSNDYESFERAFTYLKMNHNIDMFVILNNNITTQVICQLSSPQIAKFLTTKSRSNYVVSVMPDKQDNTTLLPISSILSNKKINGINNFFNYINETHTILNNHLEEGIRYGIRLLKNILVEKKNRINLINYEVSRLFYLQPSIQLQMYFEKIKLLLLQKLMSIKLSIMEKAKQISVVIMESVLNVKKIEDNTSINNMEYSNISNGEPKQDFK